MSDFTVAKIILEQLGGNRFITMTGAKNLSWSSEDQALGFKLPSRFAKQGINYVSVKLNGLDLYDIKFSKIWGHKITDIEEVENVYFDDLQKVFSKTTGLDTNLGF